MKVLGGEYDSNLNHLLYINREDKNEIIYAQFFDRSITIRSFALKIYKYKKPVLVKGERFFAEGEHSITMQTLQNGRDTVRVVNMVSKEIGKRIAICNNGSEKDVFFPMLKNNYDIPLLEEWSDYLLEECKKNEYVRYHQTYLSSIEESSNYTQIDHFYINGQEYLSSDFKIIEIAMKTEQLEKIIKTGIQEGEISLIPSITNEEKNRCSNSFSSIENMKEYFQLVGDELSDSINQNIKYSVDKKEFEDKHLNLKISLKTKYLRKQQMLMVKGNSKVLDTQKATILNHGMGVGKTIQGLSVIEARENEKAMRRYHTDLKTVIAQDKVDCNTIIVCPSHLVSKWEAEIKKEIPNAKVTIIKNINTVVNLRNNRKSIKGKNFFIINKEKARRSFAWYPAVTKHKMASDRELICKDCYKKNNKINVIESGICPSCNGNNTMLYTCDNKMYRDVYTCNTCGSILKKKDKDSLNWVPVEEKDFYKKNKENSKCPYCNETLWQAQPQDGSHTIWRKSKSGSFQEVYNKKEDKIKSVSRAYSIATYCKKYLKNFFDYCIIDELHEYANESAQTHAVHEFVNISKKVIGLTGSIANGKASSLFQLLFILRSNKMLEKGYSYKNKTKFIETYGTLLSRVKVSNEQNVTSRHSERQVFQEAPGISPAIYGDFLVDSSTALDLSDFQANLPEFKEIIRTVDLESDIQKYYSKTLNEYRSLLARIEGGSMGVLSEMNLFAMNYPDIPYNRVDSPYIGSVSNLEHYQNQLTNKERELISIVEQELKENRNLFIFCESTGERSPIQLHWKLKKIIEEQIPSMIGKIEVLESYKPEAQKREEYIHKKAKEGVQIFICNPKLAETGLDFIFQEDGVIYNYPSIIFYQVGYRLATLWQASRRSYRLIQTAECRVYYLAYENTAQITILEMMAEKQLSTSALQGNLSFNGELTDMAMGLDPKLRLAKALATGEYGNTSKAQELLQQKATTNLSYISDREMIYDKLEILPTIMELNDSSPKEIIQSTIFSSFLDLEEKENNQDIQNGDNILLLNEYLIDGNFFNKKNNIHDNFLNVIPNQIDMIQVNIIENNVGLEIKNFKRKKRKYSI